MAGTNRLAVGVAIVGVGLCAALPFSRTPPPLSDPPAGSHSEPDPRGKDAAETALVIMPALAVEASADQTNMPLPSGPPPMAQVQATPAEAFPAVPRLLELSTLPSLAQSFEDAVSVGSAKAETSPPAPPLAQTLGNPASSVRLGSPIAMPGGVHVATPNVPWREPAASGERAVPAATVFQENPTDPPAGRKHRVRDGDTLRSIARRYLGDEARYLEVFAANRHLLAHPELLPLGAELTIPADTGAADETDRNSRLP